MSDQELLGTVVGLFVQREPLKQGKAPLRRYRTDDIVAVAAVVVDHNGVVGETADGERVLDVHHRQHPRSRDPKGRAGVSFMATGDYQRLRAGYGTHLTDGSAGCTVLLENADGLAHRDLTAGVVVRTTAGDVSLDSVQVADPCVEFSRFCLGLEPSPEVGADVRQALLDLDDGVRGYKGVADGPGRIQLGDTIWYPTPGA